MRLNALCSDKRSCNRSTDTAIVRMIWCVGPEGLVPKIMCEVIGNSETGYNVYCVWGIGDGLNEVGGKG